MHPSATVHLFVKNRKFQLHLLQVGVYFTEVDHGYGEKVKYVPRSVQIDLEDGVLNRVSPLLKGASPLRFGSLWGGRPPWLV